MTHDQCKTAWKEVILIGILCTVLIAGLGVELHEFIGMAYVVPDGR